MPQPTARQRRARARHLRFLARVNRDSWRWLETAVDRVRVRRRIVSRARRHSARLAAAWPGVRRVKAEYHRRNR